MGGERRGGVANCVLLLRPLKQHQTFTYTVLNSTEHVVQHEKTYIAHVRRESSRRKKFKVH